MKIRTGFVSNSSSSSFILYGIPFESPYNLIEKFHKEIREQIEVDDENDFYELSDIIFTVVSEHSSEIIVETFMDYAIYIGRDPKSIKDDETGKQFKDSTIKELKKIMDINEEDVDYYEECWYNG